MDKFANSLEIMWEKALQKAPDFLIAILILVVGWILAVFVSKLVSAGLDKIQLNRRLSKFLAEDEEPKESNVELWISKGLYYFLLVVVLALFFQKLNLNVLSGPIDSMLTSFTNYLWKILGAALLFAFAWALAAFLRKVIYSALKALKIDEKVSNGIKEEKPDTSKLPLSKTVSESLYWIVILVFIPFILDVLELKGLLGPIQNMFGKVLDFIPNILTAAFILLIGWVIARILQKIVTNFLMATGAEDFSEKIGLKKMLGQQKLAQIAGLLAYIFVLIPVLVVTLDALKVNSITMPFSDMLKLFVSSILHVFGALVILFVAHITGTVVAQLAASLISGLGFDNFLSKLGLNNNGGRETVVPASAAIGKLIYVAVMLLAAMVSCELLGFNTLADLVSQFLNFGGRVVMGVVIFVIGIYVANVATAALKGRGVESEILAVVCKVSVLVFAGAIALRHIGLANEIINMAFGIVFGSVAVALAIAFGVGGIKTASRKIEQWTENFENRSKK